MSTSPIFVGVHELRRNWGWFLVLGVLLILVGCIALSYTFLSTIGSVLFFGYLLLCTGVMEILGIFFVRRWSGSFLHLLMGVLDILIGLIIVAQPLRAALALTLFIAVFLVIGGIYRLFSAVTLQYPHWGFAAFSGLVSILLGAMIWAEWPSSALWFIGMCIGIDLVFRGASWVSLSLRLRQAPMA
ncbi:MAG TPA: HdeD family acid-resistance protein [Gemmataceae bacterium]|jgi:uncharacterized membrane protein HdeD (DUF308 family)|nr:HdeD family acid-resistance protein [Gemmataceae bacterium]